MNDIENFIEKKTKKYLIAEKIIKEAIENNNKVLFHSADASISDELQEWLYPCVGPWLTELMNMNIDDEILLEKIKSESEILFFSEKPNWVSMKASRACNKSISELTITDLAEHGHLAIVIVDEDDMDYYVANNNKSYYLNNTEEVYSYDLPFGVEQNDIYSDASMHKVSCTLTGYDLVEFLKRNYPNENILKEGLKELKRKNKP